MARDVFTDPRHVLQMSWFIEAPTPNTAVAVLNNTPYVFLLISTTVYQIDGSRVLNKCLYRILSGGRVARLVR
jgi:hypothetical protein